MRRGARRGPTAVEKDKRNKVALLIAVFLVITLAWAYTFWRINQIGAALKEARERTVSIHASVKLATNTNYKGEWP